MNSVIKSVCCVTKLNADDFRFAESDNNIRPRRKFLLEVSVLKPTITNLICRFRTQEQDFCRYTRRKLC